jgi:hypothetical protein
MGRAPFEDADEWLFDPWEAFSGNRGNREAFLRDQTPLPNEHEAWFGRIADWYDEQDQFGLEPGAEGMGLTERNTTNPLSSGY